MTAEAVVVALEEISENAQPFEREPNCIWRRPNSPSTESNRATPPCRPGVALVSEAIQFFGGSPDHLDE